MMIQLNTIPVDIFNLAAIDCLEQLGFHAPAEWQIDVIERYLRMSTCYTSPLLKRSSRALAKPIEYQN